MKKKMISIRVASRAPRTVALEHLFRFQGHLLSVGEGTFDESRRVWSFPIDCNCPHVKQTGADQGGAEVKVIQMKNLRTIIVSEDCRVLEATSRQQVVQKIRNRLKRR